MTWDPTIPPLRDSANPLILHGAAAWYDSQIYDFTVIPDPVDATKLLGYASGMAAPTQTGTQSIGLFRSTVANFTSWAENGGTGNGQVLQPTGIATFDGDHVRLGCVVDNVDTSEIWLYYAGWSASDIKIGLAKAPYATPDVFTRYGINPILTATGNGNNDGDAVQTCSVMPPWISGLNYWVMVYEYRINGASQYRVATSADGMGWAKTVTGDVLGVKPDGVSFSGVEFHQLRQIGSTCYLIFESGSLTVPYAIYAASAATPEGPFVSISETLPLIGPSGASGAYDQKHLATPFLVNIAGTERLFFCGTSSTNPFAGQWSVGVASYNATLTTIISDTFTDADGTALTSHSPDTGPSWSSVTGTVYIQGNAATPNSDANDDMVVIDAGVSDFILAATVTPSGDFAGNEDDPDITVRFTDATHSWLVHFSSSSNTVDCYENQSSYTLTKTHPQSLVDATPYTLKIMCLGACITAYVDGVEAFVETGAQTNATATKLGLRVGHAGSPPGKCSWDNFQVQKIVAASATGSAVSSYSVAREDIGSLSRVKIIVRWNSDLAGNVSFLIPQVIGIIERVVTDPGANAPDDNYDVTLIDEDGLDVLQGRGADRDTANSEQIYPGISRTDGTNAVIAPVSVHGDLLLTIANCGANKNGTFTLYLRTE